MISRVTCLAFALVLGASVATPALADGGNGWDWTVAPYLWGAGISGDTSLPDRNGGDGITVDAGDVLDALEFGALVRVEGTSDRWRFLGDAAYLGLGRRTDRGLAEQDFDVTMAELAGSFRPNEHVDVLFGARYWDTTVKIDFDDPMQPDVKRGRDWVDPFVGFAVNGPLGDSWRVRFRSDIGGFDVGTELSWNSELLFAWDATDRFSLVLGYRHLTAKDTWKGRIEDVDIDIALSGPEVGFAFHF